MGWSPAQIENDKYDESLVTWKELTHLGFELWTVNNGSIFDNIYIGTSMDEANALADATWKKFKDDEKKAKEAYDAEKKAAEDAKKAAEPRTRRTMRTMRTTRTTRTTRRTRCERLTSRYTSLHALDHPGIPPLQSEAPSAASAAR